MNRIDDDIILEAMQTYGGSFAKAIAAAATKADSDNHTRLRTEIRIEYCPRESIYVFRAEGIKDGVKVPHSNWINGKSTYSETREMAAKRFGNLKVTITG